MLRSFFRRHVPERLKAALRSLLRAPLYARRLGPGRGLSTLVRSVFSPAGSLRLPVPGTLDRLLLRARTADLLVYEHVFIAEEYRLALTSPPHVIVDAGAHIGCATVYFAHRYPDARIIAVEPDAENLRILRRNVCRLRNIVVLDGAVWSRSAWLEIANPKVASWAFQMREAESGRGIPGVSMPDLMERFGLARIDLLKLDVEGAEREIFRGAGSWIDRIRCIVIELHDRLLPGCSDALQAAVGGRPFSWSVSGENTVVQRVEQARALHAPRDGVS